VDIHEPECIHLLLENRGIKTTVEHLESGDIVFNGVGIERKTGNDLLNSVYHRGIS